VETAKINKELALKIFKDLDKHFYNIFQNMAVFAIQMNQQTQGKVPLAELKSYLLQDPSLLEEI